MDVIVDTNILAADFLQRGARFSSLFDYLKRTDGSLVILDVVRTELLALYRQRLSERQEKAENAWKSLRAIVSSERDFPEVEIDREIQKVDKLLTKNQGGAQVMSYSASIDVAEVVRRGAHRIPPANQKGEELRDVIIWLIVLEYAKQTTRRASFISSDKGFWDEKNVKEQIESDLASVENRLELHRDLDSFIGQNNLKSTVINEDWILRYVKVETLKDHVQERLKSRLTRDFSYSSFETALEELDFAGGTAYEVSADATFVEFKYRLTASVRTTDIQAGNVLNFADSSSSVILPAANFAYSSVIDPGNLQPRAVSQWFGGTIEPAPYRTFYSSAGIPLADLMKPSVYTYVGGPPSTVSGDALFTMRVVGTTVQRIDLDAIILN